MLVKIVKYKKEYEQLYWGIDSNLTKSTEIPFIFILFKRLDYKLLFK